MYVSYGTGQKPFNKGAYSFLIAFAKQLEQALAERPDELEDTLGAIANAVAYLTGEDGGFLPDDGGSDDGIEDDISTPRGLQAAVAPDESGPPLRGRQRSNARSLVGTLPEQRELVTTRLGTVKPTVGAAVAAEGRARRARSTPARKRGKRAKR